MNLPAFSGSNKSLDEMLNDSSLTTFEVVYSETFLLAHSETIIDKAFNLITN